MALYIQKFGGTSVADVDCIRRVADRVIKTRKAGHEVVVVLSAMAGDTNALIALAENLTSTPNERDYDRLISSAEIKTIALLSLLLNDQKMSAKPYTAADVAILTDDTHRKAHILAIDTDKLTADLKAGVTPIVAGFQGVNAKGDVTTLGRGGSDATAVALAQALAADECQIFTDVDGVFDADPRIVNSASQLNEVSYDEMLQMSSLGAKVLQNYAVEIACQNQVPLRVSATFNDKPGTILCDHLSRLRDHPVTGIVSKRDVVMIHIAGGGMMFGALLSAFAKKRIGVDMLTQQVDCTFTIDLDDIALSSGLLKQFCLSHGLTPAVINRDVAKLSIVGRGLNSHPEIIAHACETLASQGVNILLTSTSEIKISFIIPLKKLEIGVQTLHNSVDLSSC
jgi:aspartate kinase